MGIRKARSGWLAAALAASLGLPGVAWGAEVTRVATAFEIDNPFDLDMSVGFARTQRRAKITRENRQAGGNQPTHIADVLEFRYTEIVQEMPLRVAISIFEDLELHAGASMYFNVDKGWGYPGLTSSGKPITDQSNSTAYNNCITASGAPIPGCDEKTGANVAPIATPGQSFRGGFGNVTLGTAWAPLSDRKDDTKPKWVLGFDYTIPTAAMYDPSKKTTTSQRGAVGDRVSRLAFATALSKRLGAIDPYVKLHYTLPIASANAFSNCSNGGTLGFNNCFEPGTPWSKAETGMKPQHVGGLLFGAEFFAYDSPSRHQQIGFDLQLGGRWLSEGRVYNEMSDALGKVLYTEEHMSLGGSFGIYARAAEFVQLKLNASLYHDTEHFLTNEPVGRDLDNLCKGAPGKCVDLDNHSKEINPSFDFRYDMPGRRFRISEVNVFSVMATGVVSF